jgi:hypothetical protein
VSNIVGKVSAPLMAQGIEEELFNQLGKLYQEQTNSEANECFYLISGLFED